eukprot:151038-Rhodomonas_salina.1
MKRTERAYRASGRAVHTGMKRNARRASRSGLTWRPRRRFARRDGTDRGPPVLRTQRSSPRRTTGAPSVSAPARHPNAV